MTSECVIYPTCCEIASYTLYRHRHIQCTHTVSHSRNNHTHVYIRCLTTLYIFCTSTHIVVHLCEYAYVYLSLTSCWIVYHTQYTRVDVHLCEPAYAHYSLTTGWIFCHKQCMHMVVHLCGCAYVPLSVTNDWIFYNIQCMHTDVSLCEYVYADSDVMIE